MYSKSIYNKLIFFILSLIILFVPLAHTDKIPNGNMEAKTFLFCLFNSLFFVFFLFIKPTKRTTIIFHKTDFFVFLLSLYIVFTPAFRKTSLTGGHYELIGLTILYFIVRSISIQYFYKLFFIIIISGLIQAIIGVLQHIGLITSHNSFFNITGGFNNPGPLAGFLSLVLLISFSFYINNWQEHINIKKLNNLHLREVLQISIFFYMFNALL